MFIDAQLQFASSQALTATADSTNILDLGVARNLFDGVDMAVVIVPIVSADHTTGDETYEVQLLTATDAAFTSPVTLSDTTILFSGLVAKTMVVLPIPILQNVLRFVKLHWILGGTTPTLTYEAFLTPVALIPKLTIYKDNVTID